MILKIFDLGKWERKLLSFQDDWMVGKLGEHLLTYIIIIYYYYLLLYRQHSKLDRYMDFKWSGPVFLK